MSYYTLIYPMKSELELPLQNKRYSGELKQSDFHENAMMRNVFRIAGLCTG